MADLKWDTENNDIEIKNGDFVLTDNISNQNSYFILETKTSFLQSPTLGVGIREAINGNYSNLQSLLNDWQDQSLKDGAKTADFTINDDNSFEVNAIY